MEIAEPFQDNEDSGILVTTVNLSPVSDINVDIGPSEESIEYSRVVDRILRESRFINDKELVIQTKHIYLVLLPILYHL